MSLDADTISLIALIVSIIAMIKSFYTDSNMEAKDKGENISEITYHSISPQGKKQSFYIDKKDEPIEFYLYKTYILIKNPESLSQRIVKIEDIDTIKYTEPY